MPTVSVIYFSGSGHTTRLAEAITKLVLAYLTVANQIDAAHRDALKQAIDALKNVDTAITSAKDSIAADKLRAEIAK